MSDSDNHTPGPWRIYGPTNVIVGPHAEDECGLTIAEVKPWRGAQTTRANAALISAAPDLLAACERILPVLEAQPKPELGDWNWPDMAKDVREAIAKAKGEKQP